MNGIRKLLECHGAARSQQSHGAACSYTKRLAEDAVALYITTADPRRRSGKLFIDYLRNGPGTTAVGTYSPRARPGFPVAAPITWKDVDRDAALDAFTLARPSGAS